jgi:hypothetical protein
LVGSSGTYDNSPHFQMRVAGGTRRSRPGGTVEGAVLVCGRRSVAPVGRRARAVRNPHLKMRAIIGRRSAAAMFAQGIWRRLITMPSTSDGEMEIE